MRRLHPNRSLTYFVAMSVAIVGAMGCHNQPTLGLTNPFLSPDRVPPPTTRVIMPGTAQPYYPGDALPAMQSGAAPAASAPIVSSPATPAPESHLSFASAGEPAVGVPSDNGDLRFALPAPPAPAPPVATAPPAPQPIQQVAAAPAVSPVQPATYNQPVPDGYYADAPGFTAPVETWRSPDVPPPQPTPTVPQQVVPTVVQQLAPVQPQPIAPVPSQAITPIQPGQPVAQQVPVQQPPITIPVQLRAVPSPQLEPTVPSTPRIRMPSPVSASLQPVSGTNGGQQAMYYVPAIPPGAVVQTVAITELPPYAQAATYAAPAAATGPATTPSSPPPQPTAVASVSRDGFRPRGSTR